MTVIEFLRRMPLDAVLQINLPNGVNSPFITKHGPDQFRLGDAEFVSSIANTTRQLWALGIDEVPDAFADLM